jgi:hypothetical protein
VPRGLSSADTGEAKGWSVGDESHLKVALLRLPPIAHPKGLKVVLPLLILQTQFGLSVAKVPTARAMLTLCLSSRVHTS